MSSTIHSHPDLFKAIETVLKPSFENTLQKHKHVIEKFPQLFTGHSKVDSFLKNARQHIALQLESVNGSRGILKKRVCNWSKEKTILKNLIDEFPRDKVGFEYSQILKLYDHVKKKYVDQIIEDEDVSSICSRIAVVAKVRWIMSAFAFGLNNLPKTIASAIDVVPIVINDPDFETFKEQRVEKSLENLFEHIRTHIEKIKETLWSKKQSFKELFPEGSVAWEATIISKLLFSIQGSLIYGMAEKVIQTFFSSRQLSEQHQHMVEILSLVDASWWDFFESIECPNENKEIEEIVRYDLVLSCDEKLTKYHYRLAIFSALLSIPCEYFKQEGFYETSSLVWRKRYLVGLLQELKQFILHESVHPNNNPNADLVADEDANLKMRLLIEDGKCINYDNHFLWECPNWVAVCKCLGIKEVEIREFSESILESLPEGKEIFWYDLISKAVQNLKNISSKKENFLNIAIASFRLDKNRLVEIWKKRQLSGSRDAIEKTLSHNLSNLAIHDMNLRDINPFSSIFGKGAKMALRKSIITNYLLSPEGRLKLTNIEAATEHLVGNIEFDRSEADLQTLEILNLFTPLHQEVLDSLEIPPEENFLSQLMVRANLGIGWNRKITKSDCQIFLLLAMLCLPLSSIGFEGFKMAQATAQETGFFEKCLADFVNLLQKGQMSRKHQGREEVYSPILVIDDPNLVVEFEIDSNGQCPDYQNALFWQCPNLIAACSLIQMRNLEYISQQILSELRVHRDAKVKISWSSLLDRIVRLTFENRKFDEQIYTKRLMMAKYGFNLSKNQLLSRWECGLLAISQNSSKVGWSKILQKSLMKSLDPSFKKVEGILFGHKKPIVAEIKRKLKRQIEDSFQFVYNSSVIKKNSDQKNVSFVKFELYQRNDKGVFDKSLKNLEQLRLYLINIIERLKINLIDSANSNEVNLIFEIVFKQLLLDVDSVDFYSRLVTSFESSDSHNFLFNLQRTELKNTLLTCYAPSELLQALAVSDCLDFVPHVDSIDLNQPIELLNWVLKFAFWKNSVQNLFKMQDVENTHLIDDELKLEIDFWEFKVFLTSNLTSEQWIHEHLLLSGTKMAQEIITTYEKNKFEEAIYQWGENIFSCLNNATLKEIKELFLSLKEINLSIHDYVCRVKSGFYKILSMNKEDAYQSLYIFDEIFIESLSTEQRLKILNRAVRVKRCPQVLPNQEEKYFCFFFNPRTQKISFGKIDENRTFLEVIDLWEWKNQQDN